MVTRPYLEVPKPMMAKALLLSIFLTSTLGAILSSKNGDCFFAEEKVEGK